MKKFEDEEEFQEHVKSHEEKSILNKPDFSHKVAGQKDEVYESECRK